MEFGYFAITCLCVTWILVAITVGFTFYVYSQNKDILSDSDKGYLLSGAITSASGAALILLAFVVATFFGGSKKDSKSLLGDSLDRQNEQDRMTMDNLRSMSQAQNEQVMPMRSRRSGWCRPKHSSRRNMENIFQDESPEETVVLDMD